MTRDGPEEADAPVVGAPAVAVAVADFLAATERERQRLYRLHLRATVRQVSPLLQELAAMEQIDMGVVSEVMQPPADWPWRSYHDLPPHTLRQWLTRRLVLGHDARRGIGRFRRTFTGPGLVIRDIGHPRGPFAVRPTAGVLGFTAAIGPCLIGAFGPTALIRLPERLPNTLMTAMPGRRLGQIVDHPLFRERDCIVSRVVEDDEGEPCALAFRVPLVPVPSHWFGVTA